MISSQYGKTLWVIGFPNSSSSFSMNLPLFRLQSHTMVQEQKKLERKDTIVESTATKQKWLFYTPVTPKGIRIVKSECKTH